MNQRRRTARNKAPVGLNSLSHEELTQRAIAAGCPGFCGGWSTKTLIRKIQEKENA